MSALVEIAGKAIADYGFRQVVLYSPDDVAARWGLSSEEAGVLRGPVLDELDKLPIPVEPENVAAETERLAAVIGDALRSG
jgi:hypothetical protein